MTAPVAPSYGSTVAEIADGIKRMCADWYGVRRFGYGDAAIFANIRQPSSVGNEFERHGVIFEPGKKGKRAPGWDVVKQWLANSQAPGNRHDGEPALYINKSYCPVLMWELTNADADVRANAAIGYASDLIVRCGGTSFIAETTETFGAGHLLTQRAKTPEIAQAYLDHVATYRSYLAAGEGTPKDNLAYGNIEGGLSTIAEKALGSVAKGGTTTLAWVNDYAELITEKGFGFMNTPGFDPASCTGQTAGGAQVGVFSTGAGSCFGGILIPWLKVVSNSDTFAVWKTWRSTRARSLTERKPLRMSES